MNPMEPSMEFHFHVKDEKFANGDVEVNAIGWDLIYFLRMLQKNNPAVVHCINSPNVCFQHAEFGEELHEEWKRTIGGSLSKLGYFQSTMSTVRNNIQRYFTKTCDTKMRVKVYLYTLQYLLHSQAFFDMYADKEGTLEEAMARNQWHRDRARVGHDSPTIEDERADETTTTQVSARSSSTSDTDSSPAPQLHELLPPLHPQELVQTTSLSIPPRFLRYFLRLVHLKRHCTDDPLVERNLNLEVWLCMNYKRLFSIRGRLPRVYSPHDEIDSLLRETIAKYFHLQGGER